MKIDDLFPRKYANGADLNGKPATVTIARTTMEEMHPGPGAPASTKPVLFFQETKKGIVLTRTLANQIAGITGSRETDAWIGKRITIYPEPMQVAGRACIAIRARKPANGDAKAG